MPKAVDNFLKILVIFLIGALGGILASRYLINFTAIQEPVAVSQPKYVLEQKNVYVQESVALEDAIKKVKDSLFLVESSDGKGNKTFGSGLVLTSDGLGITLAGLTPQGYQFKFYLDGGAPSFQVLNRDLNKNLALLKFEKNNLETVGFFDLEKLDLGKRIFLLGRIESDDSSPAFFVDEGIVSNFTSNNIKTNIRGDKNYLGAPVFDVEGNVLGLSYLDEEGIVNIIPISQIKSLAGL
jgi:S1-C subfamily serine protease